MLLAGDDSATTNRGLVRLLAPPPGAAVGDRYPPLSLYSFYVADADV
jgi:hypothetical protein